MATKKRKKEEKLPVGLRDKRIPKLFGILLIALAVYLFFAFFSYTFTWKQDQDKVMDYSWSTMLAGDIHVANWLGRLGAIISHMFFYWGFGLPSFFFAAVAALYGIDLFTEKPIRNRSLLVITGLLAMLYFSVALELFIPDTAFPLGGALGENIAKWMRNTLGIMGAVIAVILIPILLLFWLINPRTASWEDFKTDMHLWWDTIAFGRRRPPLVEKEEEKTKEQISPKARDEEPKPTTLRPGQRHPDDLAEEERLKAREEKQKEILKKLNPKKEEKQLELPLDDEPARHGNKAPSDGAELIIQEDGDKPSFLNEEEDFPGLQKEEELPPYDPTLDLANYKFPTLDLLNNYADHKIEIDRKELEANKDQIIETLLNYKIEITKIRATVGPTVTLYEIVPAPGVRISRIKNLEDDIALSLAALGIRIIAPIPGRGTIGIEVPNKKKQIVSLKEIIASEKFQEARMALPIALGKTISNEIFIADLAKMPHLLIAGATGQGKSVGINAILISLLYKMHPSQLKLVLIDPKKVELFPYAKLDRHFLSFLPDQEEPITTETNKVVYTLNSLCIEMDMRYDLLKKAHARNIQEYNTKFIARKLNPKKGHRFLPFIVLVIDEFADLIMTAGRDIEQPIGRLAQLSRAVGIHLIIATQRPSVNIITGIIKANFPARIAYKVASKVDSRTILDTGGADQLIGRGDMLMSIDGKLKRLQSAFVDTPEVERVIEFIHEQPGFPNPHYLPEYSADEDSQGSSGFKLSDLDELFEEAARLVVQNQHGSTSMIQRRLKLGYNRAGRIMDQLEAFGIVGPSEGSKAREVLYYTMEELERFLNELKNNK